MKKALLAPLQYLLIFLIVGLILTISLYMYQWSSQLALEVPPGWHIDALMRSIYSALLPGSMISIVILILRVQHKGGAPLLLFPAVWLSFSGVYLAMLMLLAPYSPMGTASPVPVELSGHIHDYNDGALYLEIPDGAPPAGILVQPGQPPRMRGGLILQDRDKTVQIGDRSLVQDPSNPFFNQALTPSAEINRLLRDFRIINVTFAYLQSSSPAVFRMTILALGLMLTAAWIFGRFTSWPLLNTVFLLFMIRLVTFLLAAAMGPGAKQLLEMVYPGGEITELLPLVMAGTAAVLIVWDLLFVPFNPRQKKGLEK